MKRTLVVIISILLTMQFPIFGQNYSKLWKQVSEAEQKDLPQTQYDVLQKIVAKAKKGKDYAQLLKAELMGARVMAGIAPDSLKPALKRMEQQAAETSDVVLKTVYQTVLCRVCTDNPSVEMKPARPVLDETLCKRLAKIKDKTYAPLVVRGDDSRVFDYDLLSVVGYELEDYEPLSQYYQQAGNRPAACLTALRAMKQKWPTTAHLDSLIEAYGDLPEAGEIAIERYRLMGGPADKQVAYIHEALGRWGSWQRMDILRNAEQELTCPQFQMEFDYKVALPGQEQQVRLKRIRHIPSLTMTVWRVDADGDTDLQPDSEEGYEKIKPLLTKTDIVVERSYQGRKAYELFDDTLTLAGLPVGVYMLEFAGGEDVKTIRQLYFVTDVYVIAQSLPTDQGVRYVVVSATTGQPIAGARLRISYGFDNKTVEAVADDNGEYVLKDSGPAYQRQVFAFTEHDRACPPQGFASRYNYYESRQTMNQTALYTDRAIYRPGQTIHAAAIAYQVKNGFETAVETGKTVTFRLRDANYKVIGEQQQVTDDYGTCATEFTLPTQGLTGYYNIEANDRTVSIRVEEYKRPTFEVTFPEVKDDYKAGDVLMVTATARTYAGVPVQGAKVQYKVMRRVAFWWWSYCRYWDGGYIGFGSGGEEIYTGEAVTDETGEFPVKVPLNMPKSDHPMFYHFVVTADVTDTAGETHSAILSLPLGNRKTALSIDVADKVLLEDQPTITFHLRNAAGNEMDAEVRYRIDQGDWLTAKTATPFTVNSLQLKSGKHTVEAVCGDDIQQREFVVFSRDDQQLAVDTDDWFWQSAIQFPNDGTPVTIQVGSSRPDVHIVYSIFSGDKVIESGSVDKSQALLNRKLTYQEEWNNGITMTFAWVKQGQCYTHTAEIRRPLPDKNLHLEWATFRDRLTPGQQEEWTLMVKGPDGQPADAQLMAALYDKSLDQLRPHQWSLEPGVWLSLPQTSWSYAYRHSASGWTQKDWQALAVKELQLSAFDASVFPRFYHRMMGYGMTRSSAQVDMMVMAAPAPAMEMAVDEEASNGGVQAKAAETKGTDSQPVEALQEQVQVRENLQEMAFFYPQLTTDKTGTVALKFTLPESLTTWRFLGLAHTKELCVGTISGETVARKEVMIQPNVPRFVREGDEATITARLFNTGEKTLTGKATLRLLDPETDAVVCLQSQPVTVKAGATAAASFKLQTSDTKHQGSLLVCQVTVSGKGFSDGEQHYLPILPATERVTVTVPFTQHEPGTKTINLSTLIPADGTDRKLTVEYTEHPAWLMIQALPAVGKPADDNAISQAAAYYANSIGQYIVDQNPSLKTVFRLWQEEQGAETSLMSALEKNQELKDLVLGETPWVLDADRESEQKQRLADFFDANTMDNRLSSALDKLNTLQRADGSWSWWKDMPGSFYMTVAVSEMLVRLNTMTGTKDATRQMLTKAFEFMGQEMVKEVGEMKEQEKKGVSPSFPSFKALQYLYLCTLDGRRQSASAQEAHRYLLPLLKKDIKSQSIYEKAMTAVILSKTNPAVSKEYVQSLKEYTVYREDMGRYYDTPRAGYSWYDYRIPTQTMAIEAVQRITPDDWQTILEMQRWLLQEKRTQAWDTPINSVNAIYAFLNSQSQALSDTASSSAITVDGRPLDAPKTTAAIGYVKAPVSPKSQTLRVDKTSEGTSWGAVYAQFFQPTKNIVASGSGLAVKRELLGESCKVGDRVTVRITIEADRNLDFVQVIDRRAACMEPVRQLSGYSNGCYCTPHDNATNYYYDRLSKGRHVIETEYYIDRPGSYETGTCTVGCAYAPEFRATAPSQTIIIK